MKKLFQKFLLLGLLLPMGALAQQLSGVVISKDTKERIPGVTVVVKGTQSGTTTDASGVFKLVALANASTLQFSAIGYLAQEVIIGSRTTFEISLETDVRSLEEVVVVGYGTVRKKDLTGAVSVVKAKEFGNVAVAEVGQLIQGKVAGVQVVNNSGLPGSGVRISVRGPGSFTNGEPLYVIDGIQSGYNDFNSISPFDIEDVTVLKDASSVAIYGARGANGVVLVTTKKGKSGVPKVSYNGYVGWAQPWKKLDMLNAAQYIDLVKDIQAGLGAGLTAKINSPDVLVDRTDWQDEIFRTAKLTEHHFNIAGGSDKSLYNISLGFADQDAIMKGYNFKRYNFRINTEQTISKRIKLGQAINFRYEVRNGNVPGFTNGLRMPPYAPTTDPNNLGGFSRVTTIDDINDAANPLTTIFLTERRDRESLAYSQLWGEWEILNGLKLRSQGSLAFNNLHSYNFSQANANGNLTNPTTINESYSYSIAPLLENTLTYSKTMGQHNLTTMIGNTYANGRLNRNINATGSNFANEDIRQIGVAGLTSITSAAAGRGASLSYFARVNYGFKDRYLLTASFRRDGSPVFGKANRFGNFPSLGVAWKVTEENFMKDISFISELKIRASWGITGNASIPAFSDQPNIWRGLNNNVIYTLGETETFVQGATVNTLPNPDLRWEETTQTDIGIDLGLFSNKIQLTFDWYNRLNDGLLTQVPIPSSTGVGGPTTRNPIAVLQNAATAFNRGIELGLTFNGQANDFKYSITGNVAYNRNEVTSLGQGGSPFFGTALNGNVRMTRTAVGFPIGYFYGYQVDKVAATQAEVTALNEAAVRATGSATAVYQASLRPGDIIFKDLNGDGRVTELDQALLGSPIPKWTYGSNINLSYKRFDAMISLQGIAGVEIYNDLNYWLEGMSRPFNSSTVVLRRWKQEGDVTDVPRAGQNVNSNLNLRPSDRFLENGAYMRVRNITLGYTLPSSLLRKTNNAISNVRLYLTLQNPITLTKYSGYDPEISAAGGGDEAFLFSRGIDRGQFPQPRTTMVGVQVSF